MGSSWKRQCVEEPSYHDDRSMGEHAFLAFTQSERNSVSKLDKFCQSTRDGTYIFNVSLGRVWRRIAVQGRHDVDKLSDGILDAFEFDDDHLYTFSYQSRFGTLTSIHHPALDEPPLTSEVRIGEVPLRLGASMTYLYDFCDRWEFDVRLERIDPIDRTMRKARILD